MHEEGYTRGEAVDLLRAWLLTEDAYAHDGVADEVLNYLQDRVTHLFGPRALIIAGDVLRRADGGLADLAIVARRPDQLRELVNALERGRRRGVEAVHSPEAPAHYWTADRPRAAVAPAGHSRPAALLVMAEYGVTDPVWNRPEGEGDPVVLGDLGVTPALVQQLREWNQTYESLALTGFEWPSREAEEAWVSLGLRLAHLLQRELVDVDVRYFHADDDRPLREL